MGLHREQTKFLWQKKKIKQIPKDRTVTYIRIVVDYRPQKEDPYCYWITTGDNLIHYLGELTAHTDDLTMAINLWNSITSTPGARYACADISNFYLATPMDRHEYMQIKADLVPKVFKQQYKLHDKIHNGYLHMEIQQGIYGLPQAGILAHNLLKKMLSSR